MSALVVYSAPAVEPLSVADVMSHLRLDESNQEAPPSAPTVALATVPVAGNVNTGVHRYLIRFLTSAGGTQGGTESSAVTVADSAVNGQVALTNIALGGSLITSREIYRTLAGGTQYYLVTTLSNNTATTYTDNVADASLGAECPTTNTTLDPLLTRFIKTARMMVEQKTRRALITQTIDLYLDRFPCWGISLPRPTLQSVSLIEYTDENGVLQTLDTSLYLVDTQTEPARVTPAFGEVWPATRWQNNAVHIRYIAGYGASGANVPGSVLDWMLFQIGTLWNTRQQFTISTGRAALTQIPNEYIDGLLAGEIVDDFDWAQT